MSETDSEPPATSGSGMAAPALKTDRTDTDSIKNLKVPAFWTHNPKLWFMQIEAQFYSNNIKGDVSKYYAVVSALDCNTLQQVADLLEKPPPTQKYDALKSALIDAFSDSNERQLKKLLTEMDLGDQKPSQLLRQMKSLASNKVTDDVLRTLWLQRLPNQVQLILSASQGVALTKMAEIADKIVEVSAGNPLSVAAITHAGPTLPTLNQPNASAHELVSLKEQVSVLTKMVEEMCVRGRYRSRSREGSRYKRTRSSTPRRYGECFYHRRFGTKARKCTKPCEFKMPENDASRRQ